MAQLIQYSNSTTSITARVTDLSTSYKYNRDFYWYLNGVQKAKITAAPTYTYSGYTFSGLSPDTDYTVKVVIYRSGTTKTPLTTFEMSMYTEAEKTGASVYIYSGGWKLATPYVYSSGAWREAEPYVYSGGWKP